MKQSATKQNTHPQIEAAPPAQTATLPVVQTKLTAGEPGDAAEREADAVADAVVQRPLQPFAPAVTAVAGSSTVQRQEATEEEEQPKEKDDLAQQPTEPDFQSLHTPFFDRNVPFLWDAGSALGIWQYNFNFFKRFGLSGSWAGKAANLTAPLFIDSQLKAANPKWWEITDQQLNTTSIVGTLPLFNFDADFRNWKPLPFLQKKAEGVQRKCEACEQEEKLQPKRLAQRQAAAGGATPVSHTLASGIESSRGTGQALDVPTRSFMESRIGADFGDVSVHTDSNAIGLSKALNAQAFTVGRDVYFNEGKFKPQTTEGQHLLAHELAHVVQQKGVQLIQRQAAVATAQPATATTTATATEQDYRDFVQSSIDFLNGSAHSLPLMTVNQASFDRMLDGWKANAETVENIIQQHLNNDAALRTAFLDAYNAALRVLLVRSATELNQPAARLYLQNLFRIPDWASFAVASIPATNDTQRRAVVQSVIDAFLDASVWSGYAQIDRSVLESLLRRLKTFAEENREIIRDALANDLAFAQQLKDAYRTAVSNILTRAATNLGTSVFDLYMTYRYGSSPLILEWADEARAGFSTPLPQGLTATASGNFEYTRNGILVTIRPDGTQTRSGARTNVNLAFNNAIHARVQQGHVVSHTGPGVPHATIRTLYGPGLTATSTSGYGRGTTAADRAEGNTSLGFHEGSHGRDFLRFMETHAWPAFSGTDGMATAQFTQAMTDYRTDCQQYSNDIERFSELQTDCVGLTIVDFYSAQQQTTDVHCP